MWLATLQFELKLHTAFNASVELALLNIQQQQTSTLEWGYPYSKFSFGEVLSDIPSEITFYSSAHASL